MLNVDDHATIGWCCGCFWDVVMSVIVEAQPCLVINKLTAREENMTTIFLVLPPRVFQLIMNQFED